MPTRTLHTCGLEPLGFVLALLALAPPPFGGPVVRPELGLGRDAPVPGGLACPVAFAGGRFGAIALPRPVLHPLLVETQAQREGRTPTHTARIYEESGAGALAWPFAITTVPVLAPAWREAGSPFGASTERYRRVITRVQRITKATAMDMPASFLAMERWELGRAVDELFVGLPPDEDGEPRPGLLPLALAWLQQGNLHLGREELVAAALARGAEPTASA